MKGVLGQPKYCHNKCREYIFQGAGEMAEMHLEAYLFLFPLLTIFYGGKTVIGDISFRSRYSPHWGECHLTLFEIAKRFNTIFLGAFY